MSCNPTELQLKCNTLTVCGPQLLLSWVPLTEISAVENLLAKAEYEYRTGCNGSFTLKETAPDSDSKPKRYIVACRTCSHCADKDSDPYSLFLPNLSPRLYPSPCLRLYPSTCRQCKWAICWSKYTYSHDSVDLYLVCLLPRGDAVTRPLAPPLSMRDFFAVLPPGVPSSSLQT